jgi:flavodoxin
VSSHPTFMYYTKYHCSTSMTYWGVNFVNIVNQPWRDIMARFMGLGRRVVGGGGARFRRPFKPTPAGSTSTTTRSTTRRCCCYSTSSVASSFRGIASGSGAILTSTGREERIPCLVGWNICSSSTTSTTCSSKRFLSSGSPQPHDVTDEEEEAPSGGGHVIICYGSQTGTAQMYADELHERAETHGRSSEVISMKSISGEELLKRAGKGAVIAFIIANFGKGQPPDNAKDMYNWFLAQQPGDVRSSFDWSRFRYTIFGLGNKQGKGDVAATTGRNAAKSDVHSPLPL